MQTLLTGLEKSDVITEPFPHIVVRNAFDRAVSDRLIAEFPSVATVTEQAVPANNTLYSLGTSKALASDHVAPLWKEFLRAHVSAEFGRQLLSLFEDHLPQAVQHLRDRALDVGLRYVDDPADHDLILDAQICINSPVVRTSTVRGPHVDLPNKLFNGLFYLRPPDYDSAGGDLKIYRFTGDRRCFTGPEADERAVETVKTVPYERDVLVVMLNSIESLHGVTARAPSDRIRQYCNLLVEVEQPIFDIESYQAAAPRWRGMLRRFGF